MPTQSPSSKQANSIFFLSCLFVLLVSSGIILFFMGKLPPTTAKIAGAFAVLIALILAFLTLPHAQEVLKYANKKARMIILSSITAIILTGIFLAINSSMTMLFLTANKSDNAGNSHRIVDTTSQQPTSTQGTSQRQGNTASPIPSTFSQLSPYCNSENDWAVPSNMQEGTSQPSCSSGLQMQQNSPTKSHYAELDLVSANGRSYSQTNFDVKVSVSFPQNDIYTYGCLLVQTPPGIPGGYSLCINNIGDWQLQNATNILNPVSGIVNINQAVTLEISVSNNTLTAFINGTKVGSIQDTLSSGNIGFLVEKTGAVQSAPVIYTNFTLTTY